MQQSHIQIPETKILSHHTLCPEVLEGLKPYTLGVNANIKPIHILCKCLRLFMYLGQWSPNLLPYSLELCLLQHKNSIHTSFCPCLAHDLQLQACIHKQPMCDSQRSIRLHLHMRISVGMKDFRKPFL